LPVPPAKLLNVAIQNLFLGLAIAIETMNRRIVVAGLVLVAVGLLLGAYYADYLLSYNSTISPALLPETLFNLQLVGGLGLSLIITGAVILIIGLTKASRR
jgi:hypothetical protein